MNTEPATDLQFHIEQLVTAELQFRLASAVRLAVTQGQQPLDLPLVWTHGQRIMTPRRPAIRTSLLRIRSPASSGTHSRTHPSRPRGRLTPTAETVRTPFPPSSNSTRRGYKAHRLTGATTAVRWRSFGYPRTSGRRSSATLLGRVSICRARPETCISRATSSWFDVRILATKPTPSICPTTLADSIWGTDTWSGPGHRPVPSWETGVEFPRGLGIPQGQCASYPSTHLRRGTCHSTCSPSSSRAPNP